MNPFMEQFGPMRYVHSRRSGLITFGGGGGGGPSLDEIKTAVSDYGNPKFDDVFGNQGDIQDDIGDALDRSLSRIGTAESNLTDDFSALTGDIGDVSGDVGDVQRDVTSGFADMDEGFDDAQADRQTRMGDLSDDVTREAGLTRSGVTDRIDQQDIDLGRAFSDTNDEIIDAEGRLTTQAAAYFTDLVDKLSTNRSDIMEKVGDEAVDTREDISDFDTRTTNTLDTIGSDLGAGQTDIQSAVDSGNANATDYFGTLSEGQTGISDQVTGLQGDFSGFRADYDDNTMLANRARNDLSQALGITENNLAGAIGGEGEATREQVGNTGAALTGEISSQGISTRGALGDVENAVIGNMDDGFGTVKGSVNNAAYEIAQGFDATSADAQLAREEFMMGLGNMESFVNSGMEGLDANTTQGFRAMTSAFDDNGKLIRNDVNDMGMAVQRDIDQNGNLLVSSFDAQGTRINQVGYNIEDMMGMLGSVQSSSIANTGLLSPAVNRSPYART
jgi:hypothetical protein